MKYISFESGDLLKILARDPSGWLYGYKITHFQMEENQAEKGYFPGNYIKTLESGDTDQQAREQEETEADREEIERQKAEYLASKATSYLDYAKTTYADRDQITIEHRFNEMHDGRETINAPTLTKGEESQKKKLNQLNKFGINTNNPMAG